MTTHHVDLELTAVGVGSVMVDHQDLTDISSGVSLVAEDGQPTKIRIQLKPGTIAPTSCADCEVEFYQAIDPTEAMITWLQQIDGDVVMARAMDSLGLGDSTKSVASLFIDELIRLVC